MELLKIGIIISLTGHTVRDFRRKRKSLSLKPIVELIEPLKQLKRSFLSGTTWR